MRNLVEVLPKNFLFLIMKNCMRVILILLITMQWEGFSPMWIKKIS